jgi:hypothetical protein
MKLSNTSILAGIAVLAVTACALPAIAMVLARHELSAPLADDGAATARYVGDAAPHVWITPPALQAAWTQPRDDGAFASFAAFNQMAADMDRQMAAMMRQANMTMAMPDAPDLTDATLQGMLAGSQSTVISTSFGGGNACTRIVQVSMSANGAKPRVVSRSSGNCGTDAAAQPQQEPLDSHLVPARAVLPPAHTPRTAL